MRRGVITSGRLLQAEADPRDWTAMVTLTYRPGCRWHPGHVSAFVKGCRRYLEARGARARYVWVQELTRAGIPHYHVLFWLPRGIKLPRPDESGLWRHGSSRIERARKPVGYLAKYASKGSQDDRLPRGARLHGHGGLTAQGRRCRSWWTLPRYIRQQVTPDDRVTRMARGGWVSRDTGEWWPAVVLTLRDGIVSWAAAVTDS